MTSNMDVSFGTKIMEFAQKLGRKRVCLFVVIRALGLLGAPPGVQYVFGTFFELFWGCPGGACTEISKKFERSFRDISGNSMKLLRKRSRADAQYKMKVGGKMSDFGGKSS